MLAVGLCLFLHQLLLIVIVIVIDVKRLENTVVIAVTLFCLNTIFFFIFWGKGPKFSMAMTTVGGFGSNQRQLSEPKYTPGRIGGLEPKTNKWKWTNRWYWHNHRWRRTCPPNLAARASFSPSNAADRLEIIFGFRISSAF